MSQTPDFKVLEEAAAWYVQLDDGNIDEARMRAWQQWLQTSPQHAAAWERVEKLHRQWARVPQPPGLDTVQVQRRGVLKGLSIVLVLGVAGWLAVRHVPYRALLAQHATLGHQRRTLDLQDGSRLVLNAGTAVDVRFDAQQRLVQLLQGEILVQTAGDAAQRPFIVQSEEGSVLALGARFSVRQWVGKSGVAVLEGAVQVRPLQSIHHAGHLVAGQQVSFDCNRVGTPGALPEGSTAWVQGVLSVRGWPLGDVLDELGRYRTGVLRCDASIKGLSVSGDFNLDDIDTVLHDLGKTLPVKVRYLTRYWVRVEPA